MRRRERDEQVLRRRFDAWLQAYDRGVIGADGRARKQSVAEIAEATGFTPQYIREGIRSARQLREALSDAVASSRNKVAST